MTEEEVAEQKKVEEQKREQAERQRKYDLLQREIAKFNTILKQRLPDAEYRELTDLRYVFGYLYRKCCLDSGKKDGIIHEFIRINNKSNIKEVFKICRSHFGHLNLEIGVEDEISSMKLIAREKQFDPELFYFFATKNNEKYKNDLVEFMYENCDDRFDFTERCLLVEDIFSGKHKYVINQTQPTKVNKSIDEYLRFMSLGNS